MNEIIKKIEDAQLREDAPQFRVGDTVRVHAKIKEGTRERIQIFEGVVIKKQGGSNRATFTVRKFSNGVGVEKTWPLHSPTVDKVDVVRSGKVPEHEAAAQCGSLLCIRAGNRYEVYQ